MNILQELLKIGFLTGSRAYGTEKPDSDYDVVISVKDLQKVENMIKNYERTESAYFKGFYIIDGDKVIDVIPVNPNDYIPWLLTTQAMCAILPHMPKISAEDKYHLFDSIRASISVAHKE